MTKTYFRVQRADRDVSELLDPGYQFSHAYNGGPAYTRVGVSVCDSVEDLAEYLASELGAGICVREGRWVLVELEADPIPGARPCDPEYETLVRPTKIVLVTEVEDGFLADVDRAAQRLAALDVDDSDDSDDSDDFDDWGAGE